MSRAVSFHVPLRNLIFSENMEPYSTFNECLVNARFQSFDCLVVNFTQFPAVLCANFIFID